MLGSVTPSARSLHAASSAGSVIAGSARSRSVRSYSTGRSHSSAGRSGRYPRNVPVISAEKPSMSGTPVSVIPPAISTMSARSERNFFPSNAEVGLHYHHPDLLDEMQLASSAGVPSAQVAYHASGYCLPRFDRQKIRAYLDQTIVSGEREVEPGMLQRIPTMYNALPARDTDSVRTPSMRSVRYPMKSHDFSARSSCASSKASTRSTRSGSSCGSWLRQREESVLRYKTNNAEYGSRPEVDDTGIQPGFQPGFGNGRELWELGRFRGKNTTDFQNCLVDNNRYVPFLQ